MKRVKALWYLIGAALVINALDLVRFLPVVQPVRYGRYLAENWFLVAIAASFGVWELWTKRVQAWKTLLSYWPYPVLITLALIITRWVSFGRWFYFDDYRILGYHAVPADLQSLACCGNGEFPLALMYGVVGIFGNQFWAYNALGLLMYGFSGVLIFSLARRFTFSRFSALLAALFFVTTPTYFHETLSMNEFMGNGFSLLLFLMSGYFVVTRFWQGAVLFGAAALEFGLSRTHFIALPLIFLTVFFTQESALRKKIFSAVFIAISAVYIFELGFATRDSNPLNWGHLLVIADMVTGVTLPYQITHALVPWLMQAGMPFASSVLGGLITLFLVGAPLVFSRQNIMAAKLAALGSMVILAAIIMPSIKGSRVNTRIDKLAEQYTEPIPTRATSYGLFPAVGLTMFGLGIAAVAPQAFIVIIVPVIVWNAATFARADLAWVSSYAAPQRAIDGQLHTVIPDDRHPKIFLIPKRSDVRVGLQNFQSIFRRQEFEIVDSHDEFETLAKRYGVREYTHFELTINGSSERIELAN